MGGFLVERKFMPKVLGISEERVQALINDRHLPEPSKLGSPVYGYTTTQVNRIKDFLATGRHRTFRSTDLTDANKPLERFFDTCLDYPTGDKSTRAHVRVWHGNTEEGLRIVVLVGALKGQTNALWSWFESLATVVDRDLLEGKGHHAVWFEYHSEARAFSDPHAVDNKLLETNVIDHRSLLRRSADAGNSLTYRETHDITASLTEVERVTGVSVEVYPAPAYSELIVKHWSQAQRRGASVDICVDHDFAQIVPLLRALTIIDSALPGGAAPGIFQDACIAIAHEIALRESLLNEDRSGLDGTQPCHWLGGGLNSTWPKTFAARLRRVRPTADDTERMARHHRDFPHPWDSGLISIFEDSLSKVREWMDKTGELADPEDSDPELHDALSLAETVIIRLLRTGQEDYGSQIAYHREFRAKSIIDIGAPDREYLRSVAWVPLASETPRSRRLHAAIWNADEKSISYGEDRHGRLVACSNLSADQDVNLVDEYAVEWPLSVQKRRYPSRCSIVGEVASRGMGGAFIEDDHGQIIDLLPRDPDPMLGEWNFGYGGSGPGTLSRAIARFVAESESVGMERVPVRFIDYLVTESDDHHLRISLDEIKERFDTEKGF